MKEREREKPNKVYERETDWQLSKKVSPDVLLSFLCALKMSLDINQAYSFSLYCTLLTNHSSVSSTKLLSLSLYVITLVMYFCYKC